MSIFPRPLKKVLGKTIPFSKEDKVPTFNLGDGVADGTTFLRGDGTWSDDFDHIDFNQFPIAGGAERRMRWNDADGTVDLGLKGGNVTLQLGQENLARVVNKTSPLIDLLESNYQVVRISGATGQRLSVRLALADNDINSATTIGIVTENIPKNQEGFITTFGLVRDINTTGSLQGETWVDGDILYLSGTVPGQLTNIKPSAPTHLIVVGYVEYAHANHGKIFVKVDNGYELDELHNVSIPTTPTNGQVLTFNGTSGLWEAQTVPTGITVGTTPVTSGTDGRVFFQSGGVVQQDSSFFWDNTNKRLGIGTSTPNDAINIVGYNTFVKIDGNSSTDRSVAIGATSNGTGNIFLYNGSNSNSIYITGNGTSFLNGGNVSIGATSAGARLDVRAQGALSTDIAFRVRNSADTGNLMDVRGTGSTFITASSNDALTLSGASGNDLFLNGSGYIKWTTFSSTGYLRGQGTQLRVLDGSFNEKVRFHWGGSATVFNTGSGYIFNGTTLNASAEVQIDSTTKGFLPPRMTTTQRTSISTPAAGLMVYDTTLNKHYGFDGTNWNALY